MFVIICWVGQKFDLKTKYLEFSKIQTTKYSFKTTSSRVVNCIKHCSIFLIKQFFYLLSALPITRYSGIFCVELLGYSVQVMDLWIGDDVKFDLESVGIFHTDVSLSLCWMCGVLWILFHSSRRFVDLQRRGASLHRRWFLPQRKVYSLNVSCTPVIHFNALCYRFLMHVLLYLKTSDQLQFFSGCIHVCEWKIITLKELILIVYLLLL